MEAVYKKECFKCGVIKELSCFYKHSKMKDGHLNKCKECTKKDVRSNYSNNKEYYVEYDKKRAMRSDRVESRRKYRSSKRGKEVIKNLHKKDYEKSPLKFKARAKLNYEIRMGRLSKPSKCEECGKECVTHGHHHDYSQPLNVKWLCSTCHYEWHLVNEPING